MKTHALHRAMLLLCCLAVWSGALSAGAIEQAKVAKVKSAYLLNFLRFAEWPADSFERADSPVRICVLGHDSLGAALDGTVNGQVVDGRPVAVLRFELNELPARFDLPEPISQCHLVFIGDSEAARLGAILDQLRGTHTLTVGETSAFAAGGTMLALNLERDRIIFYANPDAIRAGTVGLSSKILQLAKIVHGARGE